MSDSKPDSENPKLIPNKPKGPDSFGMPDLEFKPIKREEKTPKEASTDKNSTSFSNQSSKSSDVNKAQTKTATPSYAFEKPQPDKSKGNKSFLIFSIILILTLSASAVFLYLKSIENGGNWMAVFKKGAEEAATPLAETNVSPPDEDEMMIAEEDSIVIPPPAPEGPRYYVIVGGFSIPENAILYQSELIKEGYSSKVLDPTSTSPLHKVSVEDYSTLDEALKAREILKQKFDLTIWVYKN